MRGRFLILALLWEAAIITAIALACLFEGFCFVLFYHLGYGLILSVFLPLVYGMPSQPKTQALKLRPVPLIFVLFSVGGRLTSFAAKGTPLPWELLLLCFLPLAMTTFFEEFFFRGFLQPRFEKLFGGLWAVVLSGAFFSLYHLGYAGFRNIGDLLLLFAVGLGLAWAYRLSGGSVAASYVVNLPNALLTYLEKPAQFPPLDAGSSLYAGGVLILLGAVFILRRVKV